MDYIALLRNYISEVALDSRGRLSVDESENFVLRSNGQIPWIKTLTSDLKCFSVYKTKKTDEIDPVQLIKAMKDPMGNGAVEVPRGTIDSILQQSVELCVPWLANIQFNVITTPQSSKTLAIRFAKSIAERMHVRFTPCGVLKDFESIKISDELPTSYTEKSVKGLQRSLEKMKSSEEKNLHRYFRPQDRKFIEDWQKLRVKGELKSEDRILLVDDVLSDGSTFIEMQRVLREAGMTTVGCVTLFRTS